MAELSAGIERRSAARQRWRRVAVANGWVAVGLLLLGLAADCGSTLWASGHGGLEWNRIGVPGVLIGHVVTAGLVVLMAVGRPLLRQLVAPSLLVAAGALCYVSLHNLGVVP